MPQGLARPRRLLHGSVGVSAGLDRQAMAEAAKVAAVVQMASDRPIATRFSPWDGSNRLDSADARRYYFDDPPAMASPLGANQVISSGNSSSGMAWRGGGEAIAGGSSK